jgi:hypothetical protein
MNYSEEAKKFGIDIGFILFISAENGSKDL